jgi:hypothetical protein
MKAVDAGRDAGRGLRNTLGVNIDLDAFSRGARAAVDIFKQVTLNRGRPMVTASEAS